MGKPSLNWRCTDVVFCYSELSIGVKCVGVFDFIPKFMRIHSVKGVAHVKCYNDCTYRWLLLAEACCNLVV